MSFELKDVNPRQLHLNITRTVGLVGNIAVDINVTYHLPGSISSSGEVSLTYPREVAIRAGVGNVSVTVEIANDGFIKFGASFRAELTAVRLQSGASPLTNQVTPSSPRLGDKSTIFVNVTSKDANGEIGFSTFHQTVTVQEPAGPSSAFLNLPVKRSGAADRVIVHWNITSDSSMFFPNDTGPQSGYVVFEEGQDEVNITIEIKADDTPEVAETFTVNLVNVSGMDTLQVGADKAEVTIAENGNPGGTFEFNSTTAIVLQEVNGANIANIVIVRLGSALDTRWVSFKMTPSGGDDFFGSSKTIPFQPGEVEKNFAVIARDDSFPEIDEMFELRLYSAGLQGQQGVLGDKTVINITIKENDDAYGVFGFRTANIVKTIVKEGQYANLTIKRGGDGSSVIDVSYQTVNGTAVSPDDYQARTGNVAFDVGEFEKEISILVNDDSSAEGVEKFLVNLTRSSGNTVLYGNTSATVVIFSSDGGTGSFQFASSSVNRTTAEGIAVDFTVERKGARFGEVRVYWRVLRVRSDGSTTEIPQGPEFAEVMGFVTFTSDSESQRIRLTPIADNIAELDETFELRLINATGIQTGEDGVLSSPSSAFVKITANDDPNGLLKFSVPSVDIPEDFDPGNEASTHKNLTVLRNQGKWGTIKVAWEVRSAKLATVTSDNVFDLFLLGSKMQGVKSMPAWRRPNTQTSVYCFDGTNDSFVETSVSTGANSKFSVRYVEHAFVSVYITEMKKSNDDLSPINGYLIFEPYVSQQQLSIHTVDDDIPEDDTSYYVVLYSPAGGARLNTQSNEFILTLKVLKSDNANGLFGFMSVSAITVEESRNVTLKIERSRGKFGTATVNWSVYKGSSSVRASSDFTMDSGSIVFSENEDEKDLIIPVNDDMLPEIDEDFMVVLTSVSPMDGSTSTSAASLKPGYTTVNVTIQESDFPNGLLQFMSGIPVRNATVPPSSSQFNVDVRESVGTLTLYVIRAQGTLGKIKCQWKTSAGTARSPQDYTETTGAVEFPAGVRSTSINITIVDNNIAELGKTFTVELFNPEGGAKLNSVAKSCLPRSLPVNVNSTQISIRIKDDVVPELAESFLVTLTNVSAGRLANDGTQANVTISASDDPYGVFVFTASQLTVVENNITVNLTILRKSGTRGVVRVNYRSVSQSMANLRMATPNVDYIPISGAVMFSEGQRNATVSLDVLDDVEPEAAEAVIVNITNVELLSGHPVFPVPDNSPRVGVSHVIQVTIEKNDNANGIVMLSSSAVSVHEPHSGSIVNVTRTAGDFGTVSFNNASLLVSVQEREGSNNRVKLTVVRRFGLRGGSSVHWEASLNGVLATDDITPDHGDLVFAQGVSSRDVEFDVKPDSIPEVLEVIEVNLTSVTFLSEGTPSLDEGTRVARVRIEASDAPHGVVEFAQSSYNASEGSSVYLEVTRHFGTAGDIRVFYSTMKHVGGNRALANVDYVSINKSIIIPDGRRSANINISILDDENPELDEVFDVELTHVELIDYSPVLLPQIGGVRKVVVTIVTNDDAHGLMVIKAANPDAGSHGSRVTVDEIDRLSVHLIIERLKGAIGFVTVDVAVEQDGATLNSDFLASKSRFTFSNNDNTSENYFVSIRGDDIPEPNENILIRLVNPTGGARVASGLGSSVTVTIQANDGAAGQVGFDEQSSSLVVQEGSQVALSVNRTLPVGRVTVDWLVTGANASSDFVRINGTVEFNEGETHTTIVLAVRNDTTPETHEVFVVHLSNIQTLGIASSGHATLIQEKTTATITVSANDRPHGVVELADSSRLVTRNDEKNFTLIVSRLFGNIGAIRIWYEASTGNVTALQSDQSLATPGEDFIEGRRSIIIGDNVDVGSIPVLVMDDDVPELDQVFIVKIIGVELVNPAKYNNTVPPLLGSHLVSQITLSANDDPYGVFKFPQARVFLTESSDPYNITVLRSQGTFGKETVNFFVRQVDALLSDYKVVGYDGGEETLTFEDGVMEQNITIFVTDDSNPEGDEALTITLTKNSGKTTLGDPKTLEVIIRANDDSYGVFRLDQSSLLQTISEPGTGPVTEAEFVIVRTKGSYGTVIVEWEVVNASSSADLTPVKGNVTFVDGDTRMTFKVKALLDSVPEKAETFIVQLEITGNGRLASPSKAQLTITENDSPYGQLQIVSSLSSRSSVDIEESQGIVKAKVNRRKGDFGRITVDYMTISRTASSAPGDVGHFEKLQRLKTSDAYSWHTFSAFGDKFVLLASKNRTGDLPAGVDDGVMGKYYGSALFRWQGVLVPLQVRRVFKSFAPRRPQSCLWFTKAITDGINVVQEGGTLSLEVQRQRGSFRDVNVRWEITPNAGIVNASSQISPMSGTISFRQGDTSEFITLHALDDSVAEVGQSFTIQLVAVDNGGVIDSSLDQATIYIPANDKVEGVASIDSLTRHIIAGEPVQGYNGVFVIRILRQVGQSGDASVSWEITSRSDGSTPASTFNATSGRIDLPTGVDKVLLPIQVVDDPTAEKLAVYAFRLTSASVVELDPSPNSREASVTVVASDDPFGIIEIQSASPLNVSEDVGFVNLTVLRDGGNIGELKVNYSISSETATHGTDYRVFGGELVKKKFKTCLNFRIFIIFVFCSVLTFADKEDQKTIHVEILKDDLPELAEVIRVRLVDVKLVSPSPVNFSVVDGLQLNTPPRIRSDKSEVLVVINENDEARGIIRLMQSAMLVREDVGTAVLQLRREGGTLGATEVHYSVRGGTATQGNDFSSPARGTVLFSNGQNSATINITIIDDRVPEHRETFTVTLDSVTAGAKLGSPAAVVVTIETSDDPMGLFGFVNASDLSLENPSRSTDIGFVIEREGGAEGDIESLKSLCIDVLKRFSPASTGHDEPEEQFVLTIYEVSGNGSIDGLRSNISITIAKHGFPNGVFRFQNTATKTFTEPTSVALSEHFTVVRNQGTQGTVNSPTELIAIHSLLIHVPPIVSYHKHDKKFASDLANDNPHGIFKLQPGAQRLEVAGNSRKLQFGVLREKGTFGAVDIQYEVRYSQWYPVEMKGHVTVPHQQSQARVNISLSAFLRVASSFTVMLTGVRYSDSQVPETSIAPKLSTDSASDSSEVVPVPENAANAVLKFADNSLKLTVEAVLILLFSFFPHYYRANDNPHGIFKLQPGAQRLEVAGNSRKLQFGVLREKGTFGAVDIQYEVRYSQWYPVEMKGHVTVRHQQSQARVNISLSAFLRVASRFTVMLTGVRYSDSQVPETSIAPKLSTNPASDSSEVVPVPENAANAVLKFADNSLKLTVEAGSTVSSVTVVREGLFGSVSVNVARGFLAGTLPAGFTAGQVLISGSPLSFTGSMKNATFSAVVGPMLVPDKKLVYSMYLDRVLTTPADLLGGANITSVASRRTAVVEYNGVVVVAPNRQNLIAYEGSVVKCTLLRQFSVLGSVTVNYVFLGQSKALSMAQGEFSKEFDIDIADSNDRPEKDRVVFLNLTGVSGSFSPRLGLNKTVRIVVKDNDDPHGVFSFRRPSVSVPEDATSGNTRTVELEIQRTGGTLGDVSVIVRTIGGGEDWSTNLLSLKEAISGKAGQKNATAGPDYEELEAKINFANADPIPAEPQVMRVQLKIKDDGVPEPNEVVLVYLTAATGGARVATDSDAGLQSWAAVTIEGNDMMNGRIEFVPGSRTTTADEDRGMPAVLRVARTNSFGQVQVSWNIVESAFRGEVEPSQGIITFAPGESEKDLIIRLKNDNKAERKGQFHVRLTGIQSGSQALIGPANSALVIVLDSDYPNGTIQFAKDAIFKAVDKSLTEMSVEVIRGQGLDTDVIVYYETRDLSKRVTTKPGVETYRAVVGQDYQRPTTKFIRFAKQETSKLISISLTPNEASATPYPKAFEIVLLNATSGAKTGKKCTDIIKACEGREKFLFLFDGDIDRILSDLLDNIRNTLNEDQMELARDTITIILRYKNNVTLTERLRTLLMKIFDELLNPSRDDTKGQDKFSVVFEAFAFSLLNGESCPGLQGASITGTYAVVESFRRRPDQMSGMKFNSSNGKDYFKYPPDLYPTSSSSSDATCRDVHFINYNTAHWFKKPNQAPVISDKVFSTSLRTSASLNEASSPVSSRNPITYRVYTNNRRVTPKGADCVFWDYSKSAWSKEGCMSKSDKGDYVECQCDHLSVFAAQGESDNRAGYSLPFFIVFSICLGVFAVTIIIHHLCSVVNMFAAKLLMHLFFACLMGHLMFIVGAYVSPQLVNEPTRCSVFAMFFHYFFLCQFTWMFVEAWNLWRIFVLNDEHTDRKVVLFFVLGWGLPVVAVVLYILIAQLGFNWPFTVAYADVYNNGDMCFIPNAYAALAGAVGPVLLLLMGVAVVFTQAYQVTPQWKYYDDIFRGHHNIKEIRYIIILFALLTLVWLFAGLHVAYGYEWMLITFIVLDGILAVYVFIWYCCLRNQLRGVFKQSFAVPAVPPPIELREDMFRDRPGSPTHSIGSLKRPVMNTPDDPVSLLYEY
ncbi:PREDICTED: G-protein coupled receptor 98-like [Acropora digitifera]|uniref:G-protein coupled receptor 98-like n=1 Tax=Acropora digitifera TaxID=70779 RepID=UPI00077B19A0|nr:PREDICTED: G-protein coupled receptor 98-like [Acropora digitifera]